MHSNELYFNSKKSINIKSSNFLLKNLKEFTKIISSNSFNKNKTKLTANKYTAKLFNDMQEIFYPNQLIVINADFETFSAIIKYFHDILNYVNKTNDLIIIWIPESNYFNTDNKVYDTIKSLKESAKLFQIYILNWIINIDKILNKLTNLEDDKDESDVNCDYFRSKLLNINELGKFLILKFEDFIFFKQEKIAKFDSLEAYLLQKANFIFKLNDNIPKIVSCHNVTECYKKEDDKYTKLLRPSYRVALPFVEPFVISSANSFTDLNHNQCTDGIPCLEWNYHKNFHKILNISGKEDFIKKFENMLNREETKIRKFSSGKDLNRKCCSGYVINVLQRLSQDLNVDFDLYISPPENDLFGKYDNNTNNWNGLMNHILNDVADIIAGPFSITEERAKFIDYTTIFLFSSNTLLIKQDYNTYELFLFMKPFTNFQWFSLFFCGFLSAVALGLLEFNSPFGLNPKGRQRARNYTLGSAISMVTSLMFMHTMPAKSPKSWPGKWVKLYSKKIKNFKIKFNILVQTQNIIACFALIFIATYTAKMASVLSSGYDSIVYEGFEDKKVNDLLNDSSNNE